MKLIHLSDLHIGKKVNGFSMLEDQQDILFKKILPIVDEEKPDCIIIAGDVYDKSIPPSEAVGLLDEFLVKLAERNLQVFIISGNHDSAERLAFGNRLIDKSGIHISPVYQKDTAPFTMKDDFGTVNIYMLPFIKPVHVRTAFESDETISYTDAVRMALSQMDINVSERNILITHQFVTGAERSDSEDISIGGSDNVDASVFDDFDYVALGHLHRPQNVGTKRIRYCGTPLKYSFSEEKDNKSVTVVEMREKGILDIREIPLVPLHEMVTLRGTFRELTEKKFYENTSYREDYTHIVLTDENDIENALNRLREIYRNIMKLEYDNTRTRHHSRIEDLSLSDVENKSPLELFAKLYEDQNGSSMSPEQTEFMQGLIKEIWEGNS